LRSEYSQKKPIGEKLTETVENKISGLGQLAITVKDVQLSLPFYTQVLGLQFLFAPSEQLAFVQCGDTRLMLSTPQGAGEIGKNSIPYFKTTAIEQFYANAIEQGAVGERPPQLAAQMPDHQLWIGFLKDPDGNLIGLMEEKR
jgi:predicted enzyme related to lactoylglutathione lyase